MNAAIAVPSCGAVVTFTADQAAKLGIVEAVDRPLAELTVERICAACGISRGTFYNHFHSKYDMLPWFVKTVMEKTIDRVGISLSWQQGIAGYLHVLGCERRFTAYAVSAAPLEPLRRHRAAVVAGTLERRGGVRPTKEQRFLIDLYVDAEVRFCARWFAGEFGAGVGVGELCDLLERSVPAWLHAALELPGAAVA